MRGWENKAPNRVCVLLSQVPGSRLVTVNHRVKDRDFCFSPGSCPVLSHRYYLEKNTASDSISGLESCGHFTGSSRSWFLVIAQAFESVFGSRNASESCRLDHGHSTPQKERGVSSCSRSSPSGQASFPLKPQLNPYLLHEALNKIET